MSTFDFIEYEIVTPQVARIWLNRPETRNAQDTKMLYELNSALDRAARDKEVKVIIIGARGVHFSAGHDLREEDGWQNWDKYERVEPWEMSDRKGAEPMVVREKEIYLGFCRRWRRIPKVTIVQVQGKAISGGLMLIWPFDLVVAADNAQFQDNTLAMGICGVEYFAHPWEMGVRKAKEMLFTSEFITAQQAAQMGMVNRVVALEDLESATLELAEKIALKPMMALRLTKEVIHASEDAQGRHAAEETAFAYHHLAHSHNMQAYGLPIDPSFIEGFKEQTGTELKYDKGAEGDPPAPVG